MTERTNHIYTLRIRDRGRLKSSVRGAAMDERVWLRNYDPQVPHELETPEIPLHRFLEDQAARRPGHACTIFKGARLSYAQLNEMADRLAAGLVKLGVRKGQPVGIFMPNTPQFVIAFYAILKAGGVVVATNPLYSPREIEHQLNDAGVELMLVMSNFYNRIKEVQPRTRLKTLVVTNIKEQLPGLLAFLFTLTKEKKDGHHITLAEGDLWMKEVIAQNSPLPRQDIRPDDLALYQYSGGTTGLSKAAMASHRNLVANTVQLRTWLHTAREGQEVTLMAIPLFHVYGMVAGMSFGIAIGSTLVMVPNPRDLKDLLANINKYHPTLFPGVPTLYNAINNHPDVIAGRVSLGSIRACISGSAPLLLETKEKFEKLTGGKLFEGYGLSEAPTATHCNPFGGKNKEGSIGMPLPGVDCRIVSLDDGVTVLGMGEIGEMVLRGPQVMMGYLNMPAETASTLRDGWLYTGDIARMDEDGYFYIVDRKKELIKAGGFQVWPREIEEVLAEHPGILEVAAAGVPDAYRGETVKAWVVLKEGQSLTEEELKEFCKEKLARFKVPTSIEFRKELPKTTVGKVLRRELVREHQERAVR